MPIFLNIMFTLILVNLGILKVQASPSNCNLEMQKITEENPENTPTNLNSYSLETLLSRPVISISTSESVMYRGTLLGYGGSARLSFDRPFLLLTFRNQPKFVAFYPPWLKTAPIELVYAAYTRAVGITKFQVLTPEVAHEIEKYRKSAPTYSPEGFHIYSLTDVNANTMSQIFQTTFPMIFNPGRGDSSEDPLSFVLFPVNFVTSKEFIAGPPVLSATPITTQAPPESPKLPTKMPPQSLTRENFILDLEKIKKILQEGTLGQSSDLETLLRLEKHLRDQGRFETTKQSLGDLISQEYLTLYEELALSAENQQHPNYQIIQKIMERLTAIEKANKTNKITNKENTLLSRAVAEQKLKDEIINAAPPEFRDMMTKRLILNSKLKEDLLYLGNNGHTFQSLSKNIIKILEGQAQIEKDNGAYAKGVRIMSARCSGPNGEYRIFFAFGSNNQIVALSAVRRNDSYSGRQLDDLFARYLATQKQYPHILK